MPVYLSHALEEQLFIFQFPTKPTGTKHENEKIIKCSFKPEHQETIMELSVDTKSPNYDVSHGEQIAINVDGGKNRTANEKYFQSSVMDKRTMQSTKIITDINSVALMYIKNKNVFLTPIKGILSVKPSFPHLDVTDKRAKEEAKEMGEDVSGGEEEENEKQITVKFARQESDRLKKAREQSYLYLSKKSADEKWYNVQYHEASTRLAQVEWNRLQGVEMSDRLSSLSLGQAEYVERLAPVQCDTSWSLPSLPAHVTSLTALSNLPLPDIVLAILKEVKIMSFSQLCGLVAGHGDEVKLLRSVQQVAVLVQGNWVVRSECLYSRDSHSDHNGVPGDLMCRARDYILYMLSEGKVLERKQVAAAVRLPPEELKQLLTQVARLRRNKGWELLLPPDNHFIDRNPDVVERQARAWATKHKQLMEAFECDTSTVEASRSKSRRRVSSVSGGSDLEGKSRRRKDSSFSSDAESGAESSHRRKRNSESSEAQKIKTESLETILRKKRDSESDVVTKINGKSKRTKKEKSLEKFL